LGWVSTGEYLGTGAGNDGLPANSILSVTVAGVAVANAQLGIQQPPIAGNGSNSAGNPGLTIQVDVPSSTFANILNSSDVAPGTLTSIRVTAFPTGASSIVIEDEATGELNIYYPTAGAVPVTCDPQFDNCLVWPSQGITVSVDPGSGEPLVFISVDPTAVGATQVSIPFVAIDNAGSESANIGEALLILNAVPDLTPRILLLPSTSNGNQQLEITITVAELNVVPTNGSQIRVTINKNALLGNFIFNPSRTSNNAFTPVQNSVWSVTETAFAYVFTTNEIIDADDEIRFVFNINIQPGASRGAFPITVLLSAGSGGEAFFFNNNDSERLVFFEVTGN
jgi:hypothetical protein